MTGGSSDPTVVAARWLVERQVIGIIVLDRDGIVSGCQGGLVDWIAPGRPLTEVLPMLKAYEDRLGALAGDGPAEIFIPGVRLRDGFGDERVCQVRGFRDAAGSEVILVFQDSAGTSAPDREPEGKSAFLANISHELRTPLNVIIGNAEILRDWETGRLPSDDLRVFAEDILENGTVLLDHINDLLDLSKAETGGLTLVKEPVDMVAIVDEALAAIGGRGSSRSPVPEHDAEPGLPRLIGDAGRLRQVMHILLGHATRGAPDRVALSVRSFVDADGAPTIDVLGDGTGFATASPDGAEDGDGIGLPLARTLVALHDGTLAVANDDGIRITLRFPASRAEAEA